jgi:hypothetical protein
MFTYCVFKILIHFLIDNSGINNFFVCLNNLYKFLVAMDPFCKSYAEIDLASLHYVTFIEPLVIIPMESLSFGFEQFILKVA